MFTESNTFRLFPLNQIDIETQLMLRDIRNEPNVKRWMYTDHEISTNEHLQWLDKLKTDKSQLTFCVMQSAVPVGAVSLNAINKKQKTCEWAYYLTESVRGGLGAAIEFAMLDFIFDEFGMEKLNCEVIEGNDSVIKLHKKFGFEQEGFRKNNIIKNGCRIGTYYLGMDKERWLLHREEVYARHNKVIGSFKIKISQPGTIKKEEDIIDKIKAARNKKNLNWISILRLAVEKSPQTAKTIIDDLMSLDKEISELMECIVTDIFEEKNKGDFL